MPSQFSLEYFDPPPALSRYMLATFYFATDVQEFEDRHPGALGQLFINLSGSGAAQFGERSDVVAEAPYLFSGFSSAIPIRMEGPWHAVGASLSPLGWAALTRKPSNEFIDRMVPAEDLLGQDVSDFAQSVIAAYRGGALDGAAICRQLADWIGDRLGAVPVAHEELIAKTVGWLGASLNPDMESLFGELTYSRRQAERLIERYFGLPPAAVARKYRAVRAASLLSQDELSDEAEAEIADAFVDQPHMIREIRKFCGHTPSRLGGPAEPLFQTLLQMKNFDRFEQFRSIG